MIHFPTVLIEGTIFLLQSSGGITRYYREIIPLLSRKMKLYLFLGYTAASENVLRSSSRLQSCWHRQSPSFPFSRSLYRKLNGIWLNSLPESTANVYHRSFDYSPVRPKWVRRQVSTCYDLIPEHFPGLMHAGAMRMRREAFQSADGLLAISECTAQDLMDRYRIPSDRIAVTPLGVDHAFWAAGPGQKTGNTFLYVGQRGAYKNFHFLINAFAHCRLPAETGLLCFGGGAFTPSELKLFHDLGLQSRIRHMAGSDEDLRWAYRTALALVYPSLYEGFGLPLLEAMSAGCPVISSRAASLPEVGGEAVMYFDPRSEPELIYNLENICTDARLRETLAQKGLERSKRFSWEKCARQTGDFYRYIA